MTRLRERLHDGGPDRGITLAEMLVYSALLVLVLPLAGSLLLGAVVAQRDVQAVNGATVAVETVAASVEAGVRNSSAIRRTTYPNSGAVGPSELLVVRTQGGTEQSPRWFCQAWYYDAVEQTLRTRRVAVESVGSGIARPATATARGWTELAGEVWAFPTQAPPPPVFTAYTATVKVRLQVDAGERQPVVLSTSMTQRPQGETASSPCF